MQSPLSPAVCCFSHFRPLRAAARACEVRDKCARATGLGRQSTDSVHWTATSRGETVQESQRSRHAGAIGPSLSANSAIRQRLLTLRLVPVPLGATLVLVSDDKSIGLFLVRNSQSPCHVLSSSALTRARSDRQACVLDSPFSNFRQLVHDIAGIYSQKLPRWPSATREDVILGRVWRLRGARSCDRCQGGGRMVATSRAVADCCDPGLLSRRGTSSHAVCSSCPGSVSPDSILSR